MFMGSKGAVLSKKTPLPPQRSGDGEGFKVPVPRSRGGNQNTIVNAAEGEWDELKAEEYWYD